MDASSSCVNSQRSGEPDGAGPRDEGVAVCDLSWRAQTTRAGRSKVGRHWLVLRMRSGSAWTPIPGPLSDVSTSEITSDIATAMIAGPSSGACWSPGARLSRLEAVMQDGGPSPRQGYAVRCQAGEQAKGQRELGDLWFSREQDFLDQLQSGVPAFGLAGSSKPGDLMRSATDWVPW